MIREVVIPYCLSRHPGSISPEQFVQPEEIAKGTNCQLFVAGVTRTQGKYLPDYYRSSEIFLDPEDVLRAVDIRQDIPMPGDIIGFWPREGISDPKRIHVGIIKITQKGVVVLHAARSNGYVAEEPLAKVVTQYGGIACIKRPKEHMPEKYNPTALRRLGFLE